METIALYGGSFDPVHTAHIEIARTALQELGLDEIVFIPAAVSPLKRGTMRASAADRIEMLRLATEGESAFRVDPREIERGGTSFAVDTVRSFQVDYPDAKLFWLLGGDQLELLPDWRSIDELATIVTFIVFRRPGYFLRELNFPGLEIIEIDASLMDHSSSGIRERLARGDSVGDWLPQPVEAFISEHQLYTR